VAQITNNGNTFDISSFSIINSDARPVDSWTITLDFGGGNLNGIVSNVYADENLQTQLGTVMRDGGSTRLFISGGEIAPMTTQPIYGFNLSPAGIQAVPECQLEVSVEGDTGGNSGGGFTNVSQEELDAYFADFPCGVGYTAMGNGGWPMCFRTQDGQAACKKGNGTTVEIVEWTDGTPITGVMQVTGRGADQVVLVTEDGAAYEGRITEGVNPDTGKIVDAGAITVSGGFKPRACMMIDAEGKRDLVCTDNGSPWIRPDLPEDFDAVQISSTYGYECALNRKGEVWCWGNTPPKFDGILTATPSQMPFDAPLINLSADQTTICGISYFGQPKCLFSPFDSRYMPVGDAVPGAVIVTLPDDFEPNAVLFHGAYSRGVIVRSDGTAAYYTSNGGTELPIPNIIAGGGKRDAVSVLTAEGDVYAVNSGAAALITSHKAANPICPRQ
jgi:hypothetical protein